jgi:electron transfer flavoprotein alpha subunit
LEQVVSYDRPIREIATITIEALDKRVMTGQAGLEIRTIPIEVPPDLVLPTAMPPVAPDFKTVDIVYAGRIIGVGSGSRDSIALVDELADLLGAAIGTTRVVVDDGFFPKIRMIGQTGKTVSPGLYLALGVSGSPHHVAGIQGSIEVLSVNTDPNAPIFGFSDKGFVGDLRSLLPKLVDRIRRYRDEGLP